MLYFFWLKSLYLGSMKTFFSPLNTAGSLRCLNVSAPEERYLMTVQSLYNLHSTRFITTVVSSGRKSFLIRSNNLHFSLFKEHNVHSKTCMYKYRHIFHLMYTYHVHEALARLYFQQKHWNDHFWTALTRSVSFPSDFILYNRWEIKTEE